MPDAPDYTLLSDVNIIGGVTLNVNVVGSVTLNVNVTNASLDVRIVDSTVTLNVNVTNANVNVRITGQTINVSVINPTGIPLYIAQPVRVQRTIASLPAAGPVDRLIVSVTGRSRFLSAVIYAFNNAGWGFFGDIVLRIIADGVTNDFTFSEIARWNGGRVFLHTPAAGSFIEAPTLSNLGGWTYAETTSTGVAILSLVAQLQIDTVSSLEVHVIVPSTITSLSGSIYVVIGFYP